MAWPDKLQPMSLPVVGAPGVMRAVPINV